MRHSLVIISTISLMTIGEEEALQREVFIQFPNQCFVSFLLKIYDVDGYGHYAKARMLRIGHPKLELEKETGRQDKN